MTDHSQYFTETLSKFNEDCVKIYENFQKSYPKGHIQDCISKLSRIEKNLLNSKNQAIDTFTDCYQRIEKQKETSGFIMELSLKTAYNEAIHDFEEELQVIKNEFRKSLKLIPKSKN